ncbi:MAG: carboxypeptidase-like regulatory domain-containing protein, partial [Psychroserpens sp.]|nr:carboxypeptidase-like regulatory domain-containing protein [Psychroserpens sp.]
MKNISLLILLFGLLGFTQDQITGEVLQQNLDGETIPAVGASVFWLDTAIGTITEPDGTFSLHYEKQYKYLIISYVGFQTDTITVNAPKYIKHVLKSTSNLDEVVVTSRKQSTAKSYFKAANVITVSSDELLKAACCNLSESFETNPSIDVNFSDALTGTRQIKMLGLTSKYILIATENIPSIRGASQAFGLSFIPGTWVESIQITKGAGSVTNGFESIAGQINTELQKPSTDDRFYLNVYGANSERLELNTHLNTQISDKWSSGLYIHGDLLKKKHDVNNDGFLDMPLFNQINVMNRWQYTNPEKGLVSFINLRYLNDSKQAGQVDFDPDRDKFTTNSWGSEIDTERFDLTTKFGYVNPEIPWQSVGAQFAFSTHNQQSYYGLNVYDINHNSVYSNLIYNSIISDSRHKIKTGLSFTYD